MLLFMPSNYDDYHVKSMGRPPPHSALFPKQKKDQLSSGLIAYLGSRYKPANHVGRASCMLYRPANDASRFALLGNSTTRRRMLRAAWVDLETFPSHHFLQNHLHAPY